jgi:hypothetical protein
MSFMNRERIISSLGPGPVARDPGNDLNQIGTTKEGT